MTDTMQILIGTLAASDAIWSVDRQFGATRRHTAIYEMRRDFPAAGVTVKSLTASRDAHLEAVAMKTLTDAGLIVVHHPRWAKTRGLRLTPQGDAVARRLAGWPTLRDVHPLLQRLATLARDDARTMDWPAPNHFGGGLTPGAWVNEIVLADVPWPPPGPPSEDLKLETRSQAYMLLPLLSTGLVASGADAHGIAWHCPLPAGIEAASRRAPKCGKLPKRSPEAEALYNARFTEAWAGLESAKPTVPNETGELPLPASGTSNPRPGSAEAWTAYRGAQP